VLRRLTPALLLVLSATSASQADLISFRSAEECRTQPGPAAPSGHWVYRIDRTNHRRCWFLASGGANVRSRFGRTKLVPHRDEPAITGDVRRVQEPPTDPNVSPAITEPRTALAAEQLVTPQFAPPALEPAPQLLVPVTVSTISYKRPSALIQTPLEPSANDEQKSAANGVKSNLLADAAATSLLLAGGALYLAARIVRYRRRRRFDDARKITCHRVPIVSSPSLAAELPSASKILEKIRVQNRTPS
jgi:hypothetical protein